MAKTMLLDGAVNTEQAPNLFARLVSAVQGKTDGTEAQIAWLQSEVDEWRSLAGEALVAYARRRAEIDELRNRAAEAEAANIDLREDVEDLRELNTEAANAYVKLRKEAKAKDDEIAHLRYALWQIAHAYTPPRIGMPIPRKDIRTAYEEVRDFARDIIDGKDVCL
jgi:hypothetical protein